MTRPEGVTISYNNLSAYQGSELAMYQQYMSSHVGRDDRTTVLAVSYAGSPYSDAAQKTTDGIREKLAGYESAHAGADISAARRQRRRLRVPEDGHRQVPARGRHRDRGHLPRADVPPAVGIHADPADRHAAHEPGLDAGHLHPRVPVLVQRVDIVDHCPSSCSAC